LKKKLVDMGMPKESLEFAFTGKNSRSNGMRKALVALGVIATLVLAVFNQLNMLSMNAVCAAAMPGTTLGESHTVVMEAPWWAPLAQKEAAFSLVCAGRTRSRLVVGSGKMTAYSLAKDGVATTLWQKRITTAKIGANGISLQDKKSQTVQVETPWSL
jgi:hypothetical protein